MPATYAEIREEILYNFDVPPSMTGDIRSAVDVKMKRVVERYVAKLKPRKLFKKGNVVTATSSTTSINIGSGGFEVTDLSRPFGVSVDKDTTDDDAPDFWDYWPYDTWLDAQTVSSGDIRPKSIWTINQSDAVVLKDWPEGTDTWNVAFWYYAQVAAISDSGYPELPDYHHGIVATAVTVEFPQLFQGDRAAALTAYKTKLLEQERELMAEAEEVVSYEPRMAVSPKQRRSNKDSFWPTSRLTA